MAARSKRVAAKSKAKPKAKPAAAKTKGPGKRDEQRKRDLELVKEVKELRGQDKTHAQIAKALNIQPTKALFLDCIGQVKPAQKIKELTPEIVAELRDEEKLAWHVISARTYAAGADSFVSVGRIKTMYKEATGKLAQGRLSKPSTAKPKAKAKPRGKKASPSS